MANLAMSAGKSSRIRGLKNIGRSLLWRVKLAYTGARIAWHVALLEWRSQRMSTFRSKYGTIRYFGDVAEVSIILSKEEGLWIEEQAKKSKQCPSTMIHRWIEQIRKAKP